MITVTPRDNACRAEDSLVTPLTDKPPFVRDRTLSVMTGKSIPMGPGLVFGEQSILYMFSKESYALARCNINI